MPGQSRKPANFLIEISISYSRLMLEPSTKGFVSFGAFVPLVDYVGSWAFIARSGNAVRGRGGISSINARIWTPPHCKPPLLWRPCRLHTYIRPLTSASIRCRALMGYSRVGSQSLLRALCTWTLEGFADAGSTGLPLLGLLRNRGVGCFSRDE